MRILVTGGGGFLGSAIVKALLNRGYEVRSFSRGNYPELGSLGAEHIQGDLSDEPAISSAVEGCEAVIHTAAKAGVWGEYEDYYNANVFGTENVLKACLKNKVKKLVYTSSPSVIFGSKDQEGVNESEPYPKKFLCDYPRTKAMAEEIVLKANGKDILTVSLRPHLIWGPGDNHLIPRIISRAKSGKLRLVGDGSNIVDTVYIDNAAYAHLAALDKLSHDSPIAGKAYFITNGEPLPIVDIFNKILRAAELPPVEKTIPLPVAYAAGAVLEFIYKMTGRKDEPLMTRFVAKELGTSHWFDVTAAKEELGYTPSVSIDEGMIKLGKWLKKSGISQSDPQ